MKIQCLLGLVDRVFHFVNSHQRSLFDPIDFEKTASEFVNPLYSTTKFATPAKVEPTTAEEGDLQARVARLTKLVATMQAKMNSLQVENVNLTHMAHMYSRHNTELLLNMEDRMLGDDPERKDGKRLCVRWANQDQLTGKEAEAERIANNKAKVTAKSISDRSART